MSENTSISRQIAQISKKITIKDIDQRTIDNAKIFMLDCLGCILSGSQIINAKVIRKSAEDISGTPTIVTGSYSIKASYISGTQYVSMGRFYVSEVSRGAGTTTLTGYDSLSKLSGVEYVPTVTAGVNGYKISDILNDIASQTGAFSSTTLYNNKYVTELFSGDCRQEAVLRLEASDLAAFLVGGDDQGIVGPCLQLGGHARESFLAGDVA